MQKCAGPKCYEARKRNRMRSVTITIFAAAAFIMLFSGLSVKMQERNYCTKVHRGGIMQTDLAKEEPKDALIHIKAVQHMPAESHPAGTARVYAWSKGMQICALPSGRMQDWQRNDECKRRWRYMCQMVKNEPNDCRMNRMKFVNMRMMQQGPVMVQQEVVKTARLLI